MNVIKSYECHINPSSDYFVYSHSVMAQEMLLYPICTGHFFYESGYSLSRDAYDSYLILYIESGSMTVAIRGNKLSAMAGNFVLIDCYQPHAYRTDAGCECYWCHFDGVTAKAFFYHITERMGNVFSLREPEFPKSRLKAVYRHFANGAVCEPIISRYLNDILTAFLLGSEHESAVSDHHAMVETIVSYIGEHLSKPITVEMLARQAGLSPYYFIRMFRKATGFSPHEYLRTARINTAKYLLVNTRLPLKDICLSTGFSCESVFCHAFKETVKMTPTEYRNRTLCGSSHLL